MVKRAGHETARPLAILQPLHERLEMDTDDMTADALLGARVASPTQTLSLTVYRPVPSADPQPDREAAPDRAPMRECRKDGARAQDQGMRGKFVRFLEKETSRKRESLGEVRRRSMCESDCDRQEQLSSISDRLAEELGQLEELLAENREALVDEHLENLHDRSFVFSTSTMSSSDSKAAPPSPGTPPLHWRSRAKNVRRTPYQVRRDTSGSCGSSEGKRSSSADSDPSNTDSSAQRMSAATQAYCRTVSQTVAPIMNPIDRALSRFANLIHGPTPTRSTLASVPVLPSRPAACGQQKGTGREPAPRKSVAQLRKEVANEFWAHMMCGTCAQHDNAAPFENPITVPIPKNEEEREKATRAMEMKMEQHVANLNRQGPGNVEPHVVPQWTEPEVPVSSLQIREAADAITGQQEQVVEAVVELHMSRVANTDAKSDTRESKTASLVDSRRALIHALGCKVPAATAIPARLCQPLPDPASPMTPLPDGLSPVSNFLARMSFEEASSNASKPQQTPTGATCFEEEQVLGIHTELCGELVAQSSLEYEAGAQGEDARLGPCYFVTA